MHQQGQLGGGYLFELQPQSHGPAAQSIAHLQQRLGNALDAFGEGHEAFLEGGEVARSQQEQGRADLIGGGCAALPATHDLGIEEAQAGGVQGQFALEAYRLAE